MENINFEEKIDLSNYTTIKVGGFAEYFALIIQSFKLFLLFKIDHRL